jgi:hypothetical protein
VFAHEGRISTRAEHDVAHLMIARNGILPWRPIGARDEVCLAEFNAVHLEVLLVTVGSNPFPLNEKLRLAAAGVIPHMQWFAEVHFSPFPVTAAEALSRFWRSLAPERILPLIPLFQRVRCSDQTQGIRESVNLV